MKRLAIATNIVAPYRIPLYDALASDFDVRVITSGSETNRSGWDEWAKRSEVSFRQAWGGSFAREKKDQQGNTYDLTFMHINPGLLFELTRWNPEAIITTEMGVRTLICLLYGVVARVPVWIWWGGTVHTERSIGPLRSGLRAFLARWAPNWISYGRTSTEYLRSISIPRSRICQIQNSVDETRFSPHGPLRFDLDSRKTDLLCVGQLMNRKGIPHLLRALREVLQVERQFRLHLVGTGPEEDHYKDMAGTFGLSDHVVFHGRVAPEEMPAVYRSCDALVFPTLEDVWGLVVNEAIYSRLPVLSSVYAGSTHELVPEPNHVDPRSHASLVQGLLSAVRGELIPSDPSRLLTTTEIARKMSSHIMDRIQ